MDSKVVRAIRDRANRLYRVQPQSERGVIFRNGNRVLPQLDFAKHGRAEVPGSRFGLKYTLVRIAAFREKPIRPASGLGKVR